MLKTEEYKTEIEQMVEEIEDQELIDEIMDGVDFDTASPDFLSKRRKLAQIYLHDELLVKKDEWNAELQSIESEKRRTIDVSRLIKDIDILQRNWNPYMVETSDYKDVSTQVVRDIRRAFERLHLLEKQGLIQIKTLGFEFNCDFLANEPMVELLKRELEIYSKVQKADRLLQKHSWTKLKCVMGDSYYKTKKANIMEEIKKWEEVNEG